ncbi:MAG: DUF2232 domain-containing protein [Sarcina sp.]
MENLRSKPLIEGAIFTGIVSILMIISNIPGLMIIANILVPIPVAILYIRHKWKISILSIIVGIIITTLMFGPILGIYAGLFPAFIGIPLGIGVRGNKSGTVTLFYMVIGSIVSYIISGAITIYVTMGTTLNGFFNNLALQYKSIGEEVIKTAPNQQVADNMKSILSTFSVNNIKLALPIGIIVIAFIGSVIIYTIARNILTRLRFNMKPLESFSRWYVSPIIIAIAFIFVIISVQLKENGIVFGTEIFIGAWGILLLLFVLQGLSLAGYFLIEKLKANKLIVVIIFVFLITSGMFIYLIPIGLVDIILDYRHLNENSIGSIIRKKFDPKK